MEGYVFQVSLNWCKVSTFPSINDCVKLLPCTLHACESFYIFKQNVINCIDISVSIERRMWMLC